MRTARLEVAEAVKLGFGGRIRATALGAALLLHAILIGTPGHATQYVPRQAWVWAELPTTSSYTPSLPYQHNPMGFVNVVRRRGIGQYVIELPGFGRDPGHVQVTAYGTTANRCKVAGWGPDGGTMLVWVTCHAPSGAHADTRFTAYFTSHFVPDCPDARQWCDSDPIGPPGGYVLTNQPSVAHYTPGPRSQWNSSGATNYVTRLRTGVYRVYLPGVGNPGGSVQVTAFGGGSEYCKATSRAGVGTVEEVGVVCFDGNGQPKDTRFTLLFELPNSFYMRGYVVALYSTLASYVPAARDQYNASGQTNTVERRGTGLYQVRFPGLGWLGGNVLVTGYQNGSDRCHVQAWYPDGSVLKVLVRCVDRFGQPADERFVVRFER